MSTMSYMTIWCIECIHWCSSEFISDQSDRTYQIYSWFGCRWIGQRTIGPARTCWTWRLWTKTRRSPGNGPVPQCPSAVRRLTSWHGPWPWRDLGARAIWDQRWSRSWFFLMFFEDLWGICHYYLFRRAKWKARCVATLHTATTSRFWARPTFIEKLQAPAKPHPFHLNGDGFGWVKPKIR